MSAASGDADALSVPPYAARAASTIEVSGFVDHADHTAYEVKLGPRVVSAKRYSAFRDFHAQIFAALALDPRFPIPKAVRHSASLKRDRVAKLSQYLQQVCERAPGTAAALSALIAFLELGPADVEALGWLHASTVGTSFSWRSPASAAAASTSSGAAAAASLSTCDSFLDGAAAAPAAPAAATAPSTPDSASITSLSNIPLSPMMVNPAGAASAAGGGAAGAAAGSANAAAGAVPPPRPPPSPHTGSTPASRPTSRPPSRAGDNIFAATASSSRSGTPSGRAPTPPLTLPSSVTDSLRSSPVPSLRSLSPELRMRRPESALSFDDGVGSDGNDEELLAAALAAVDLVSRSRPQSALDHAGSSAAADIARLPATAAAAAAAFIEAAAEEATDGARVYVYASGHPYATGHPYVTGRHLWRSVAGRPSRYQCGGRSRPAAPPPRLLPPPPPLRFAPAPPLQSGYPYRLVGADWATAHPLRLADVACAGEWRSAHPFRSLADADRADEARRLASATWASGAPEASEDVTSTAEVQHL